jgi:hypothetical protein
MTHESCDDQLGPCFRTDPMDRRTPLLLVVLVASACVVTSTSIYRYGPIDLRARSVAECPSVRELSGAVARHLWILRGIEHGSDDARPGHFYADVDAKHILKFNRYDGLDVDTATCTYTVTTTALSLPKP